MLTVKQVKKYSDVFQKTEMWPKAFTQPEFTQPSSYKLRLCYLKEGKLCRLSFIGKKDWEAFTDFVNKQDDLTEDMLVKAEVIRKQQPYPPLGTHFILKDGKVIEVDVAAQVKLVYDTILEAAKVFE